MEEKINNMKVKEQITQDELMNLLRIKDYRTLNTYLNSHIITPSCFTVKDEEYIFNREEIFKLLGAKDSDEPFITFEEVCNRFNITYGKLLYRVKRKEIPCYRLSESKGAPYLFRASEIEFIDNLIIEWEGSLTNLLIKHDLMKKVIKAFLECKQVKVGNEKDTELFKQYFLENKSKLDLAKEKDLSLEAVAGRMRSLIKGLPGIIEKEIKRYEDAVVKYEATTLQIAALKDENSALRMRANMGIKGEGGELDGMYKLLATPIRDLDFSYRTHNCLKLAGIETLGDLIKNKPQDLLRFRNFGKKCLYEVEDIIEQKGLILGTALIKVE